MKQINLFVIAVSVFFLFMSTNACDTDIYTATSETPTLKNVTQINVTGFGDEMNRYAFSTVVYKEDLYVGTLNVSMLGILNFFYGLPAYMVTKGAEIWRYNSSDKKWTQVVSKGLHNPFNIGVRKMVTYDDCIYGVTANHNKGMEVWRTCNGDYWEVVAEDGFGDSTNTSGRGMGIFNGYLYVGVENRIKGGQLYRTKTGLDWEMIADHGIQDSKNWWLSDLTEFNGYLYTGTLNYTGITSSC